MGRQFQLERAVAQERKQRHASEQASYHRHPRATGGLRLTHGGRAGKVTILAFSMKPTFTQKEYLRLLELAHLGMWVVTGYQGDDTAAAKRYFDLDQKLLELAEPMGCADLVEQRTDGTLQPSPKLAEEERVREIQGDFSNDAFWHELVARLADRDYATEQAKRALADTPGVDPPPTPEERIQQMEDLYWTEFEKNDLANVIVLRGGNRG